MRTYTFCLNVEVYAHDEVEAHEIAEAAKRHLTDPTHHFEYKTNDVEIDDVEEL